MNTPFSQVKRNRWCAEETSDVPECTRQDRVEIGSVGERAEGLLTAVAGPARTEGIGDCVRSVAQEQGRLQGERHALDDAPRLAFGQFGVGEQRVDLLRGVVGEQLAREGRGLVSTRWVSSFEIDMEAPTQPASPDASPLLDSRRARGYPPRRSRATHPGRSGRVPAAMGMWQ